MYFLSDEVRKKSGTKQQLRCFVPLFFYHLSGYKMLLQTLSIRHPTLFNRHFHTKTRIEIVA